MNFRFSRALPQGPLAHAGTRGIPSDGRCRAGPLNLPRPGRTTYLPSLPSVRPWRACHVLRAHRGFAGAAHPRQVVTPQMGYSFLFAAKQLRPRLTWLLASTPAFYEAYRRWNASLSHAEPASSDRSSPTTPAP